MLLAQGQFKLAQSLQYRAQQGQLFVVEQKPRQCGAKTGEADTQLHHPTNGDLLGEVTGHHNEVRQEASHFDIHRLRECHSFAVGHQAPPVLTDGGEGAAQAAVLACLPPIKSNLLGVFTDADQQVAKVRLVLLLPIIEPGHGAADFFHQQ
ncbi:hypothetical protein D3C84_672850 [compost metagenome]